MKKEDEIRVKEANNNEENRRRRPLISEEFPKVLEISLELKLNYPNAFNLREGHFTSKYSPSDKAYFRVSCINRDCLFSDLELDKEVRDAVRRGLNFMKGIKICNGYNTFGCYEQRQGLCMSKLDYQIEIKYN